MNLVLSPGADSGVSANVENEYAREVQQIPSRLAEMVALKCFGLLGLFEPGYFREEVCC